MKKNGITLLALIFTILITLIIVSASVISVSNIISNSRISNFVENMSSLEDQVMLYYIENKDVPKVNNMVYTKSDIITLANGYSGVDVSTYLNEELTLNGDNNSSVFYKLDLSKINVTRIDESDNTFVIAMPSLHVYSLNSISAKNTRYFALSSKINSATLIRNTSVTANLEATVTSEQGVRVTQKSNEWSNKLKLTIESYINSGEKLYIRFNNKDVLLRTTENENNSIYFDSLVSTEQNGLDVSNSSSSTFTVSDMELLSSLETTDKYIKVIKKDNSENIIADLNVYLFNFDYDAPSVGNLNNSVATLNNNNILTIYGEDFKSGIKEARYEYLTTYDRIDGMEGRINYYSGDVITREYLVYNGKVAKADNSGKIEIEVPKGISSIKLVLIDNALNVSDSVELASEPEKEIYYSASNLTSNSLTIKFYGVALVPGKYSYSTNDYTYSNAYSFTPRQNINISNVGSSSSKLYIKVTSGSMTRKIEISLPKTEYTGTNVKSESSTYNPYIPAGFIHTEGTVDTGFVIQDISETASKYNEFVWIPVDGKNVGYGRVDFGIGTIASFQNVLIDNKNQFGETSTYENAIKESISNYGGFYVARYEASNENENTKSVKNADSISNVTYTESLSKANSMYNRTDINSTLMTAACFDTIINYLNYSKYNVTTVSTYNSLLGNFSGSVIKTGSNNNYVMNNIYDLSGNLSEFTTETYKGSPVFRGGSFSSDGENRVCASRAYNSSASSFVTVGFRAILYII